ncbi:hypothetical protein Gogos_015408 [Gossypium gossypioides]|uniref:DUF4283 domain-containing protein n=1 Tax=Gossypium gossypioides TaxID=34282 RepID=A0A7J9C1J4_GOSGO|nr:hypothetical protein [Gossypium gossypioides]
MEYPNTMMTWIQLPSLSSAMYKRSSLMAISEIMGKVVKTDSNANNGSPGRFAWMVIYIDLRQPLMSKIWIEGKLQRAKCLAGFVPVIIWAKCLAGFVPVIIWALCLTGCVPVYWKTFGIVALIGSTRKLAHYHQHLSSHFGS